MGIRGAWPAFGRKLAREVGRVDVIHAFSNAGFWTMSALLDAMTVMPARVVLDSAPGFPEKIPMRITAKFATAAMMPGLLASLGRRPRLFHPILSPPIALFFGAWHLVAREQVRFMETGQARVAARLRGVPLLAIWSDADVLVPAEHVSAFLDRAEREGVPVERLHFADSAHVRHFVQHRAEYFARIERFVGG
jgi:pimeloyl-ACP methyl ester carboxylesterase